MGAPPSVTRRRRYPVRSRPTSAGGPGAITCRSAGLRGLGLRLTERMACTADRGRMPEPAALTIAARSYSDRQYVFTENERLWRKAWLLIAAADQVAEPGDFTETRFGLAPTMVVRGDDGRLR